MTDRMPPQADGLYDPRYEHDACGVAMVARLDNVPGHDVVVKALEALDNLEHRGAEGADIRTGDGAGLLLQLPHALLPRERRLRAARARALRRVRLLPAARRAPPPPDRGAARAQRPRRGPARPRLARRARSTRTTSATRPTPRARTSASSSSRPGPGFEHDQDAFERKLYVIRRIVELAIGPEFYSPSCSSRTCVYKGMLKAPQLRSFYPDLQDERFASALALVHSRFSTNTFPSWELAHPYRVICHNGEINTLMGNVNWMRARESQLASELFGIDLQKVLPVVRPGGSDSATFDNVLELLMLAGPLAAARGDDDDPGGLPGSRRPLRRAQGLLRLPLLPDGAVGRPGGGGLHQRPRRRRDARPQRPAPRALGRDQGRLRRPGLGDRDAQRAPGERQAPRAPAAGQDLPRRPRRGADRRGRGGQARDRDAEALQLVVRRARRALQRPRAGAGAGGVRAAAAPGPARLRLHAGGPARAARADGARGRGADRLDGQRRRARRALRPAPAAVQLLQAALRAGHQPADRLHPRVDRHVAGHRRRRRGQPARPRRRSTPISS